MNDVVHSEMHDELAQSALLADFVPATVVPGSPEHATLVAWSKYERATERTSRVQVTPEVDVVLVRRPDTGGLGLVMREFLGRTVLAEGADDLWLRSDTGVIQQGEPVDDDDAVRVDGRLDWEQLSSQVQVFMRRSDRRARTDYQITAQMPVASVEAGEAWITAMRRAVEFRVARDIGGFGSVAEPASREPIDAGF